MESNVLLFLTTISFEIVLPFKLAYFGKVLTSFINSSVLYNSCLLLIKNDFGKSFVFVIVCYIFL